MTSGIGEGGGGAFEDTDGDAVAELQKDHADFGGGDARNVGAVDADEVNEVVYLDAYDTLQAAVDATPVAGRLHIPHGRYPVSEYGTATREDPITITGDGAGYDSDNTEATDQGSIIVQDTQQEPVLFIDAQSNGDNRMTRLRDFGFDVTYGAQGDTAGNLLKFSNCSTYHLSHVYAGMNGRVCQFFESVNYAFLGILTECVVRFGKGRQVNIANDGGGNALRDCNIQTDPSDGGDSESIRVNTDSKSEITGGQVTADPNSVAILLDGSNNGEGQHYLNTRIEDAGTGVKFVSQVNNAVLDAMWFGVIENYCVDFDSADKCTVRNPVQLYDGNATGDVFRFNNAYDCAVIAHWKKLQTRTYNRTGNGSRPNIVFSPKKMVQSQRDNIAQPIEGMEIYNVSDGNLNLYDGSGWILPDGTST